MNARARVGPAPMAVSTSDYETGLAAAFAMLDVAALRAEYKETGGVLVLPPVLPMRHVEAMVAEAEKLLPRAKRSRIPFVRTAGAIHHGEILKHAPALLALQSSPAFMAFCASIVEVPLELRKSQDPHASALYTYTCEGDHVDWHLDECGCVPNASFTVVLGLVNRSRARLEFDLHHDKPGRNPTLLSLGTPAGTLVLFCGSKGYHHVTPLERGGQRISYSFVYVNKGHHPTGFRRLQQVAIDTTLYFGIGSLVRRVMRKVFDS